MSMYFGVLYIVLRDFIGANIAIPSLTDGHNSTGSLVEFFVFMYVVLVGSLVYYSL